MTDTAPRLGLLNLPEDVWNHLLPFIAVPSALSLALTCQELQRIVDPVIYRTIDVTRFPEEFIDVHPSAELRELELVSLAAHDNQQFGLMENGWTNSLRHRISSRAMLEIITQSILARPERATFVRKLALVESNRNWKAFVALFQLVSPHLVELEMSSTTLHEEAFRDIEYSVGTRTSLSLSDNIRLPNLRSLAVPIESVFRPLSIALMGAAKHLKRLTVNPVAYSTGPHLKDIATLPPLPNLEAIYIREISPDIVTELPPLISGASRLRHVQLYNDAPGRYYNLQGVDAVLAALAKQGNLESLAIDEALVPTWSLGGFEQLRRLELRVIRDGCWSRTLELTIPPLPNLVTLVFLAYDPSPMDDKKMFPCTHGHFDDPSISATVTPVSPAFLDALHQTPNLHTIYQRTEVYASLKLSTQVIDLQPEFETLEESIRVREYRRGPDTLFHFKIFSHLVELETREIKHLTSNKPQNRVSFNGVSTTQEQLEEVYSAAGLDADWEEGLRDAGLPEPAWDLLASLKADAIDDPNEAE